MLRALRGAVGFLTRIPAGAGETEWEAFAAKPTTMVLVGYLLGALLVLPLLTPIPEPTAAVAVLAILYGLTGITHLDGLADLGDGAVVHGDSDRRMAVMQDTTVGVGGVVAVVLVVFGLGLGVFALAFLPLAAFTLLVVAEVSAKAAMGLLVCLGTATHDGLGSALTEKNRPVGAVAVLTMATPAVFLTWPRVVPAVLAVAAGLCTGLVVGRWAQKRLGGLSGDVLGAANELARVVALHAGVIGWTLL